MNNLARTLCVALMVAPSACFHSGACVHTVALRRTAAPRRSGALRACAAGGPASTLSARVLRRTLLQLLPVVASAGVAGSPAAAAMVPRALQELTDECETDACITKARRVFRRVGRKFEITQEFGSSQSRSTGSAVWEGDVVLTKYMESEMQEGFWKGKKVLELGAGKVQTMEDPAERSMTNL